ncbi:DUF1642 domain-containing protein [Enterococcus faecium]
MNTLEFKEGQTYICTKSDKRWWTVGKEYPVFLDIDNEPVIKDDDGYKRYLSYMRTFNNQFKLKEEQPKVTLDEPQKPVVPKFVAEWFEENKDDLDTAIFGYLVFWKERYTDSVLYQWFDKSKNKPIETLIRMKDGYEVEKEPLYYVRLPYEVWDEEAAELKTEYLYLHYEITSDETRMFPTKEPRKGFVAKLDELTIKSADERYWPFAVPVEEVAK